MKKSFLIIKVLKVMVIAVVALSVFSTLVMLLWNHVLAAVTSVGLVTFWQAMGLLVLSKILFGGFRGGWGGKGGAWKTDMKEKWQNMTSEERQNFKAEWKNRCRNRGFGPRDEKFKGEGSTGETE